MAFKPNKNDRMGTDPLVALAADTATAYKIGMALKLSGGKAALAAGTDAPSYICVQEGSGLDQVAAIRVQRSSTYKTELTAAGTTLKPGDKVTISGDGMGVTATTTGGVAEIVTLDGTAVGDGAEVRF